MIKYWFLLNNKCLPWKKKPHQGASLNAPPIPPTVRRATRSRNRLTEFGIIRAYFCLPSTSPHINQHPSSSSFSLSLGVGFPLPSNSQNRRQIYAHPLVFTHTHSHNSTPKSGFPIAPAHTKQNVSSDYRCCFLFASGVSILNLFFFFLPQLDD